MPEPNYPRIAYEAWAARQGFQDGDFDELVPWDALSLDLKDAWDAAIDAALNAQIPADIPRPKAKRGSKSSY